MRTGRKGDGAQVKDRKTAAVHARNKMGKGCKGPQALSLS